MELKESKTLSHEGDIKTECCNLITSITRLIILLSVLWDWNDGKPKYQCLRLLFRLIITAMALMSLIQLCYLAVNQVKIIDIVDIKHDLEKDSNSLYGSILRDNSISYSKLQPDLILNSLVINKLLINNYPSPNIVEVSSISYKLIQLNGPLDLFISGDTVGFSPSETLAILKYINTQNFDFQYLYCTVRNGCRSIINNTISPILTNSFSGCCYSNLRIQTLYKVIGTVEIFNGIYKS